MDAEHAPTEFAYALFLADLDRDALDDTDGHAEPPPGNWRDVEGPDELPE